MLDFLIAHGDAIIAGILSIIGIIISSITSSHIAKRKYQGEEYKSLKLENQKLREELNQLKDISTIDKSLDKTHGTIYYETMPDGSKRSICGLCWEQSHKKIPLKTHYSSEYPGSLNGHCAVCKATCYDTLEPQYDHFQTENERITII